MRSRTALAFGAIVTLLFAGGAGPALAAEPVPLDATRVLDQSDVLSAGEESDVDDHLRTLSAESGVDLWVVYVDRFESPPDAEEWANDTANLNNLGPEQYLLAVATEGRSYYLSGDSAGPVSESDLLAIESELINPTISQEDWAGAATAAADGLRDAVAGDLDTGGEGSSSGGFTTILIIAAAAAVVVLVVVLIRSRRRKTASAVGPGGQAAPPEQISLEELSRQAASALVQTDDALKTSEQELGFARAQFGDDATAEFATVLAQAKADLDRAFTLQQQLDDSTPDSDEQARAWNEEILALTGGANDALDAKAEKFDELRQLEQNAPEALARVQEKRGQVASALSSATAELDTLRGTYAPDALATVADNPTQAEQRLAFADEQLANAQTAIGAGDGSAAAISIRAAEDAVGQAEALHNAIAKLREELTKSEASASELIADLEKDIATATAFPDSDGRIRPVIDSTRQAIASAKEKLGGTGRSPLAALSGLDSANTQIDALVAGVRDQTERAERATHQLNQLLTQAGAQVSAAEDFITSRRGAVGVEARTRLAEAGALVVQARSLASSSPEQALQLAQRANDLAAQATRLAQNDVGSFAGGNGLLGGGSGGGNMMGAVLGGIVINSLLGGGRSSGGGMFGGGGRSRGGGGGFSPGSFGGGGTRSRRGGGRF